MISKKINLNSYSGKIRLKREVTLPTQSYRLCVRADQTGQSEMLTWQQSNIVGQCGW